jgi:hypothetical protein
VLGNSYEDRVAVIIYGGSIIASGALLVAHWRYATSNGLCAPDLAPQVVSVLGGRIAIGMVVSALAIAVGFIDTRISLAVFCLLPVPYMRRSALERAAAQRQ